MQVGAGLRAIVLQHRGRSAGSDRARRSDGWRPHRRSRWAPGRLPAGGAQNPPGIGRGDSTRRCASVSSLSVTGARHGERRLCRADGFGDNAAPDATMPHTYGTILEATGAGELQRVYVLRPTDRRPARRSAPGGRRPALHGQARAGARGSCSAMASSVPTSPPASPTPAIVASSSALVSPSRRPWRRLLHGRPDVDRRPSRLSAPPPTAARSCGDCVRPRHRADRLRLAISRGSRTARGPGARRPRASGGGLGCGSPAGDRASVARPAPGQAVADEATGSLHAAQAVVWGMDEVMASEHPDAAAPLSHPNPGWRRQAARRRGHKRRQGAAGRGGEGAAGSRPVSIAWRLPTARRPSARTATRSASRRQPGSLDTLQLAQRERRAPGPGQVEVRMAASGRELPGRPEALGNLPRSGARRTWPSSTCTVVRVRARGDRHRGGGRRRGHGAVLRSG